MPYTVNHTTGGGSACDSTVSDLNGFYYACGDRVSMFVTITTTSSYKGTSSSIVTLTFSLHPALTPRGASNNCAGGTDDSTQTCSGSGAPSVAVVTPKVTSGLTVQLNKLIAGITVVLRLDFQINCTNLPSTTTTALTLATYKIGSGAVNNVGITNNFNNQNDVLNCNDGNLCTTDSPVGDYCSRTCSYVQKDCSDENVCTTDSCNALLDNAVTYLLIAMMIVLVH
jgi:hypothetical protein